MLQTHIIRENGLYDTPALFLFSGECFLTYLIREALENFLQHMTVSFVYEFICMQKLKYAMISLLLSYKFSVQSHLLSAGFVNSDLVWNHIADIWCIHNSNITIKHCAPSLVSVSKQI